MTNKKFKLAAMSLALSAAVVASPVVANAEEITTPSEDTEASAAEQAAEEQVPEVEEEEETVEETEETETETEESESEEESEGNNESEETEESETEEESADKEQAAEQTEANHDNQVMTLELNAGESAPADNSTTENNAAADDTDAGKTEETKQDDAQENVATNGNKTYATLQGALDDAADGDQINLNKDTKENITIFQSIKLFLNGHTITAEDENKSVITIEKNEKTSSEKLNVEIVGGEGTDADGNETVGTITGSNATGIVIEGTITGGKSDTTVKLEGVTIKDNTGKYGGGIRVEDAELELDDCDVEDNTSQAEWMGSNGTGVGGGILAVNSKLNVKDTIFANNEATGYWHEFTNADGVKMNASENGGGAISANNCETVIEGSTFTGNKSTGSNADGGAIAATYGKLSVDDSTFTSNTAVDCGGAINARGVSGVTITNSTFGGVDGESKSIGNSSKKGGAINVSYYNNLYENRRYDVETATFNNVKILNNTSSLQGGGINISEIKATATVINSTISGNKTGMNYGGGLCFDKTNAELSGCTISGNSGRLGGGLAVNAATVNVKDSFVTENKGTVYVYQGKTYSASGAGVYTSNGAVTLQNVNVTGNGGEDTSAGGGVYAYKSDVNIGKDTVISGNTAKAGAGVYSHTNKTFVIDGATINNNTATNGNGGGVYVTATALADIKNSTISGNSGNVGGGIYTVNNTLNVENTKFVGNEATGISSDVAGGAIFADNCKTTIAGSTFTDNKANRNNACGGAVATRKGELTITSATAADGTIVESAFTNNSAAGNGGAVFTRAAENVTINNSTFDGNKGFNGGAYASINPDSPYTNVTNVNIENVTIKNNEATNHGGALFFNGYDHEYGYGEGKSHKVTVIASTISGNTAAQQGGGITAYATDLSVAGTENADGTVNGTVISGNTATFGGGVLSFHSDVKIGNGTVISGNTASSYGGGVYSNNDTSFEMTGTKVENNTATVNYGGGMFVWATKENVKIDGCSISGNKARLGGGLVAYAANVDVKDSSITDNKGIIFVDADNKVWDASGAGILATSNSNVNLQNVVVTGNGDENTSTGGAIAVYGGCNVTTDQNTVIQNNTSVYGGGLYVGMGGKATISNGTKLYNNTALTAGDDVYLAPGTTVTITPVGDDWVLDDCNHNIDNWYVDGANARWDGDNRLAYSVVVSQAEGVTITVSEDGSYTISVSADAKDGFAFKAAHFYDEPDEPEDDEPVIVPTDVVIPPVQDATPDAPVAEETVVSPEEPVLPAVQDATVEPAAAALPQTGVNWFAALTMAMSGAALAAAGAFISLFGKSEH